MAMHQAARLLLAIVFACTATLALAERRVALVIGNDAYENISSLKKAVNDAQAIADTLEALGFSVTRASDVTRRDMNRTIQQFVASVEKGDTAMFFYAGHGVEIEGENYLLPVDVPNAEAAQAEFIAGESMKLDDILARLRERDARLNLVVLDACRNNPFSRTGTRSLGGGAGLARISAPQGTFVMYSADVGEAALDRLSDDDENPNSVFTRTLIPLMKKPGLDLVDTAREVRRQVRKLALSVRHDQTPAYYDAVLGDFFFSGDAQGPVVEEAPQVHASLPTAEGAGQTPKPLREEVAPRAELPAQPPGRSLIVTGGEKDTIRLWDAETASLVSELEGEKIEISTVKLVSGGRALVVAGRDGALFSYSLPAFKKINALYPGFATTAIAELPDGKLILGGANGMMAAVDPLRFEILWTAGNHGDIISPILVAQDGASVISASGDGTIAVSDTATGKRLVSVETVPGKSITDITFLSATTVVAVHEDGVIAYINTRTGKLLSSFSGQRGWISSVAQTPDGSAFVTAGVDGSLSFWATGTSTRLARMPAHSDVASGAKFMKFGNENHMISAGFDGFLKLWDSTGQRVTANLDHGSAILHFDHTGK